jgi:tRNA 5-methylaminomethyl-2-thiouridine biosynthesis bifunctional protein
MSQQDNHLIWQNDQPYSTLYGDVYFSTNLENPNQGLEETDYVFLQHNQLESSWKTLNRPNFTIAETGFGTGLNFLCACALWAKTAPQSATLTFITVEKHPISAKDMAKIHKQWPNLSAISAELLAQYQVFPPGLHSLTFNALRVRLILLVGDATAMLGQLVASVDAWFLDGFSPAKNPDMWQLPLYQQMARLSHAQTCFATFTSAGHVKRGLQAAGFVAFKAKGYGKKREMLYGYFDNAKINPTTQTKSAIVIGGGIAGCATAYALAMRGWQVKLLERNQTIADAASGNPFGILYPRLSGGNQPQEQLSLTAYLFTLRLIKQLQISSPDFNPCGLLQLGFNARELQRIQNVGASALDPNIGQLLSAKDASAIAGISLMHKALYLPEAGFINPKAFCNALVNHPNILVQPYQNALQLVAQNHGWQVQTQSNNMFEASHVVICNAIDALQIKETSHLPIAAVRGQMTVAQANLASEALKCVLCAEGYITPSLQQQHYLGATFSPNNSNLTKLDADNTTNLTMAKSLAVELAKLHHVIDARVALRCLTPDYLPLLGALVDTETLAQNLPKHINPAPILPSLKGLYINVAHGAKGLTTAPYCAHVLAEMMSLDAISMPISLLDACNPNRFYLKKMGLKSLISASTLMHN